MFYNLSAVHIYVSEYKVTDYLNLSIQKIYNRYNFNRLKLHNFDSFRFRECPQRKRKSGQSEPRIFHPDLPLRFYSATRNAHVARKLARITHRSLAAFTSPLPADYVPLPDSNFSSRDKAAEYPSLISPALMTFQLMTSFRVSCKFFRAAGRQSRKKPAASLCATLLRRKSRDLLSSFEKKKRKKSQKQRRRFYLALQSVSERAPAFVVCSLRQSSFVNPACFLKCREPRARMRGSSARGSSFFPAHFSSR